LAKQKCKHRPARFGRVKSAGNLPRFIIGRRGTLREAGRSNGQIKKKEIPDLAYRFHNKEIPRKRWGGIVPVS